MAVIAERLPPPPATTLELAPAPGRLGLAPGSSPIEPVRSAIRRYRAGVGTSEQLIASVDRNAEALGEEIARLEVLRLAEFARGVARLEALHARIADLLAQGRWLREFPSDTDQPAVPLAIELDDGRRVSIPTVLAALRRTVELDERLVLRARRRRPGRRGAAASMAALADRGVATTDVADAAGVSRSKVYAMLTGRQPATPELRAGLKRLLGYDQAAIVLDGIPDLPRARRPESAAVQALHAAGVTAEDVAPLIPVQPGSVRRWLRGAGQPSPRLAGALEQLLDSETAARIVALIPDRARLRAAPSPALQAFGEAGGRPSELAALMGTTEGTTRRWLAGSLRPPSDFAAALEQLVDVEVGARVIAAIPSARPLSPHGREHG